MFRLTVALLQQPASLRRAAASAAPASESTPSVRSRAATAARRAPAASAALPCRPGGARRGAAERLGAALLHRREGEVRLAQTHPHVDQPGGEGGGGGGKGPAGFVTPQRHGLGPHHLPGFLPVALRRRPVSLIARQNGQVGKADGQLGGARGQLYKERQRLPVKAAGLGEVAAQAGNGTQVVKGRGHIQGVGDEPLLQMERSPEHGSGQLQLAH